MVSIERIYKTKAYDKLEAFCDDDEGGDSTFTLADKYDRQQVINLVIPIIRAEERKKLKDKYTKKPLKVTFTAEKFRGNILKKMREIRKMEKVGVEEE